MLRFKKMYEWLFASFRVNRGTLLLERLKQEGICSVMVVKRSWLFGVIISFLLLVIALLIPANAYLTLMIFGQSVGFYIETGLSIFLISFLIYSTILYLVLFRRVHKITNSITDIKSAEYEIRQGDYIFSNFFNRVTLVYFMFGGILIFNILYIAISPIEFFEGYVFLHILCIVIQLWGISYFRKNMVRMEMNYNVVAPGRLYFIHQRSIYTGDETLEHQNVKLIKSAYPNFIASFLNFWNIVVYPDGMLFEIGKMSLKYINDPINTSNEISKLIQTWSGQTQWSANNPPF